VEEPPEDPANHPVMKYPNGNRRYRIWRCMNERETLLGEMEVCGHVEHGLYPPEECPGEMPLMGNGSTAFDNDKNLSEERTNEG
jgi:hypothetical protein